MWTRKVLQITTPRDTPKPCDYRDRDKIDVNRCFFGDGASVRVRRRSSSCESVALSIGQAYEFSTTNCDYVP